MVTGWAELEGQKYLFGDDGAACTGWWEDESGRYYFDEAGAMVTGWLELEEGRYYFSEEGIPHTGWLEIGEYRYYLLPDGRAATGKQEIEGKIHYFTPKGIRVLLVNPWNHMPGDYELNLVEIEDGYFVDESCLEALKAMMAAMREQGMLPLFSSAHRNRAQQQGIWNNYVQRYLAQGYDEATANAMTAAYVAVPGTSEHHTGLAVDIVGHDYFYGSYPGSTRAVQAWLKEHCWEYGFILRYTKEKQSITGFAAETWHFRYVGIEVSMDMKDSGLCLEEYLGAYPVQ
jgi:D-alanyl-D-alanine carboxypeptidase